MCLLSVPPQCLWHMAMLPSSWGRAVAEVKSASEILVSILGIDYCKCLYINSWSFTKLTPCHDEYNHLWDYCFISQIKSLLASEPSSHLFEVFFAACTYSMCLFQICLYCCFVFPCEEVNTATVSSSVFSCLQLRDTVVNDTAKPGQNPKLWILTLLNHVDLAMCLAKRPFS